MAFDLKTALSGIAPTLATMLGGPLAGAAVTALEGAFGLGSGAGPDGITKVLQTGAMTPETIAAVRAADQRHAELMSQQGIDLAKINADHEAAMASVDASDRDSARKLQLGKPSLWPGILSAVTTLAVLGVIAARMYGAALPNDPTTVQLIGSLTTGWGVAMAYWFGTTHSSREKNSLLAQSTPPG
ncbi:MAG: hypothetical protein KGL35_21970 [Bradyrhizobium sp.]|nr:hypothetical protein [Bradyrhizobium sp.]